jgi:[ribosomal protein S5]-alanine N-acetyltransferase
MTLDDVPALHEAMSDPEVMRYWSTLPHDAASQTRAWVADTMAAVAAGSSDDFAVVLNGDVIGKAGIWQGQEIGMFMTRRHWRRGYAREAVAAVLDRAFGEGIEAVVADVDPRNEASLALLQSLGFGRSGEATATLQRGDEWLDSLYLRLDRQTYLRRRAISPPLAKS